MFRTGILTEVEAKFGVPRVLAWTLALPPLCRPKVVLQAHSGATIREQRQ